MGDQSALVFDRLIRRRASSLHLLRAAATGALSALVIAVAGASAAQANWGAGGRCGYKSEPVNEHCYGLAGRNIERYGGVLASIDFVDTTAVVYNGIQTPDAPAPAFNDEEEWISWPTKENEWIETGQSNGEPNSCCEEHPFRAKRYKGHYAEYTAPTTVPVNNYNHYVLYDAEHNGVWHIYWGCCEVDKYGGGWPVYLMNQEAGIEAATYSQPYNWGRQEVAASNGGEWTPWSGAWWSHNTGICIAGNIESSAAGNIMWSTEPGC